jgi:hypothetical protein
MPSTPFSELIFSRATVHALDPRAIPAIPLAAARAGSLEGGHVCFLAVLFRHKYALSLLESFVLLQLNMGPPIPFVVFPENQQRHHCHRIHYLLHFVFVLKMGHTLDAKCPRFSFG